MKLHQRFLALGLLAAHAVVFQSCGSTPKRSLAFAELQIYVDEKCNLASDYESEPKYGGGWGCFAKGTLVNTPKGLTPIENLKVDDDVYSFNDTHNEVEIRKVKGTSSHAMKTLCQLKLKDQTTIFATPNHKFYFPRSESFLELGFWKQMDRTAEGDGSPELLKFDLSNSDPVRIHSWKASSKRISFESIARVESQNVYNIEVEINHNYFVNGILVHNKVE